MGGGKFFCFVEKKNEWIENGVCINLLSCPPITFKKKKFIRKNILLFTQKNPKEKHGWGRGERGRWLFSHVSPQLEKK